MKTKTWGGEQWSQVIWPTVYEELEALKIPDDEPVVVETESNPLLDAMVKNEIRYGWEV